MKAVIARNYKNASFVINRQTQDSAFFSGPLANQAVLLVDDLTHQLPDSFLNRFHADDRSHALADFVAIRTAVLSLFQESPTTLGSGNESQTAFQELSAYAIRNWQLTNANLELTYLCNQRCGWCYLGNFRERGLSRERMRLLAEDLKKAGVVFILLTGGEVFTRGDAISVLEDLEEVGFILELKTNGTVFGTREVERLARLHFLDIQVSVYEMRTDRSELTGAFYNFAKLQENVRLLLRAGLPVTLSVLVGKHNVDQLDVIHENLTKTGASVFYSPYITPNRGGPGREIQFRLSRQEMEEKFKPFLDRIGTFPSRKKYRDCRNNTVCFAGRDQIAISPSGVVYPCLDLQIPLGHINQESLGSILARRKETMQQFSLREMHTCMRCPQRNFCDSCIGLALVENGDYRMPSKHKCDVVHFYAQERR